MAEQDKDRDLDDLLDSVLARYSDAQPRPGLETRVMAQLRADMARKKARKWRLSWMWAGAAATALVVAVAFVVHRGPVTGPPPLAPSAHAPFLQGPKLHGPGLHRPRLQGPGPVVAPPSRAAGGAHRPKTKQHQEEMAVVADTRPDVFPTPTPLSDQEKLLVRYLARTPRNEIASQSRADEHEPSETAGPLLLQTQPPAKAEFNSSTR